MIVVDTHVWYWWVKGDSGRLSTTQVRAIETAPQVGISAVSCYEFLWAVRRGRIELSMPTMEWLDKALSGSLIKVLPLTLEIVARAVSLTERHKDPFDRIIIATALQWDGQLVSVDGQFSGCPELANSQLR